MCSLHALLHTDLMLQVENCSRLLQINNDCISVAEAHQVMGLLQAQMQKKFESQQGPRQEATARQTAAEGRQLAKEITQLTRTPANRGWLRIAGVITAVIDLLKTASDNSKSIAWANCLQNLVVGAQARSLMAIIGRAISPLLRLCFSKEEKVQIAAVGCLATLSMSWDRRIFLLTPEFNRCLMAAGAISAVLHLLRSKSETVVVEGARLAAVLSQDAEHGEMLGAAGVIPLLVPLLEGEASQGHHSQCQATLAILYLAAHKANQGSKIADAGAIRTLMPLLHSACSMTESNAAAAIMSLALDKSLHKHIIQEGAVKRLLDVLQNGSERAQYHAAGALVNLSMNPASRPSMSAAVGPLKDISKKSQNKQLRWTARRAVSHLKRVKSTDINEEQEGSPTSLADSNLHVRLSAASDTVEKRCKAASLWM